MRIMVWHLFLPALSLFCFHPAKSGDSLNCGQWGFSISGHYGFIAGYEYKMAHLINGHTPGFEIGLIKPTSGLRLWHRLYHLPETGVSIIHFDFANPVQLGSGTGAAGFINFPILRTRIFSCSYRLGTGMGYITKTFDRTDNYKNNAVGAHLNIFFNFLLETKLKISKKISLTGGIGLTHFSNGAVKMPNLGINIPAATIGLRYGVFPVAHGSVVTDSIRESDRKMISIQRASAMIIGSLGVRDIYPSGGYRYKGFFFTTDGGYLIRHKRLVTAGPDLFYDSSIPQRYLEDTSLKGMHPSPLLAGIHLSHFSVFSKIYAGVQMGFYFFDEYKRNGLFYHRLMVRYRFGKHLLAGVSVKTHWAKADYLEWGLGIIF